jgi:hypothetical protein
MKGHTRLLVSITRQKLFVMRGDDCVREFVVSTAARGTGFEAGSLCTPIGRFLVHARIGSGEPLGTIFKARVPVGCWQPGDNDGDDLILTRILQLDGLDPDNANTLQRYIYIHGTNREDLLGQPSSHGCVRLSNADMIELFDMVDEGDMVEIRVEDGWPQTT